MRKSAQVNKVYNTYLSKNLSVNNMYFRTASVVGRFMVVGSEKIKKRLI